MTLRVFTIADTSPAAASTAVGTVMRGLAEYQFIRVDAALVGATGGALDVYLQRSVTTDVWADWVHFAQLTAGAAAVRYTLGSGIGHSTAISTIGIGSDAAPGVALAAAAFTGGHPGDAIRPVYVAGASTSAGAAVSIRITAWRP